MKARLLFIIIITQVLFYSLLQAEQAWVEAARNKLLKEELTLARANASYFIFNLHQKNIQIKARGMVLREWKVEGLRSWGNPAPLKIISLQKKSALFAPKRKKIKPGENQFSDTFELNILELKDMPSAFILSMSDGLSIYVRPGSGNFFSRLVSLGRSIKWYSWLPLKNLWFQVRKRPFACLDLRLSIPDEAKALYWAIGEGFKGIIFPAFKP